jgi:hypothetical protein
MAIKRCLGILPCTYRRMSFQPVVGMSDGVEVARPRVSRWRGSPSSRFATTWRLSPRSEGTRTGATVAKANAHNGSMLSELAAVCSEGRIMSGISKHKPKLLMRGGQLKFHEVFAHEMGKGGR